MKHILISTVLLAICVILLVGCARVDALNTLDTDIPASTHEAYVAYLVNDGGTDGEGEFISKYSFDMNIYTSYDDSENVEPVKTIVYNGIEYEGKYFKSYNQPDHSIIDEYLIEKRDIATDKLVEFTTYRIERNTNKLMFIGFGSIFGYGEGEKKDFNYEKDEYYIEIAQKAISELMNTEGYEVRCEKIEKSSGYSPYVDVYFEKYYDDIILSSSSVAMKQDGVVSVVNVTAAYEYATTDFGDIDIERAEGAVETSYKEFGDENNLTFNKCEISGKRFIPDENGNPVLEIYAGCQYTKEDGMEWSTCREIFWVYLK